MTFADPKDLETAARELNRHARKLFGKGENMRLEPATGPQLDAIGDEYGIHRIKGETDKDYSKRLLEEFHRLSVDAGGKPIPEENIDIAGMVPGVRMIKNVGTDPVEPTNQMAEDILRYSNAKFSVAMLFDDDDNPETVVLIQTATNGYKLLSGFENPDTLRRMIEQLIAYRRYLCPDAADVDAGITWDEFQEKYPQGE